MKKIIVSISILAIGFLAFISLHNYNNVSKSKIDSKPKDVNFDAKHDNFDSLSQLEQDSPLIVVGEKISKEKSVIEKAQNGAYKNVYSLSDFKISEIKKNKLDIPLQELDTITILENGAFDEETNQMLHIEGYELMKENQKYLLYLKKSTTKKGIYYPNGVTFGKVPLENNDVELYGELSHVKTIINEAKEHYKNENTN